VPENTPPIKRKAKLTPEMEAAKWKPGQSGNPGGRPKSKLISEAYRFKLSELVPDDPHGRTFAELIADGMVVEAVKGKNKVSAAGELADRTEGKPKQSVEHTGVDGGAIEHTIRFGDGKKPDG